MTADCCSTWRYAKVENSMGISPMFEGFLLLRGFSVKNRTFNTHSHSAHVRAVRMTEVQHYKRQAHTETSSCSVSIFSRSRRNVRMLKSPWFGVSQLRPFLHAQNAHTHVNTDRDRRVRCSTHPTVIFLQYQRQGTRVHEV